MIEPGALLAHDRQRVLAGDDGAAQVDGVDAVEGGFRDLGRRGIAAGQADADVVVQDVDAAPQLHGLGDGRRKRRLFRDVGLEGHAGAARPWRRAPRSPWPSRGDGRRPAPWRPRAQTPAPWRGRCPCPRRGLGPRRRRWRSFPQVALSPPFLGNLCFHDQRIDHRHAFAVRVHEHGVEVDLGDRVGVVGGELGQPHHQLDERVDVGGRLAAVGIEQGCALQAGEQLARLAGSPVARAPAPRP